jgi:hypothetical protein
MIVSGAEVLSDCGMDRIVGLEMQRFWIVDKKSPASKWGGRKRGIQEQVMLRTRTMYTPLAVEIHLFPSTWNFRN